MDEEEWSNAELVAELGRLRRQTEARDVFPTWAYLLQNVSDAVIATDMTLGIRLWNRAAEKIYGWREEQVLGEALDDLLQTDFLEVRQEEARRVLLAEGVWRGEVTQRRRDGSIVWIAASVSLIQNEAGEPIGGVTINRDITARRQAEEALRAYQADLEALVRARTAELEQEIAEHRRVEAILRESEERFEKAFDTDLVAMAISRKEDGAYIEANAGFIAITGYAREELLGHTSRELGFFSDDQRQAFIAGLEAHGRLQNQELTFSTKQGDFRTILYSVGPIRLREENCLLATMVDITDRKRAEDALRRSEQIWRATFDAIPDPALLWERHPDGSIRVAKVNKESLALSQQPVSDFLGSEVDEFFAHAPEAAARIRQTFETGERQRVETFYHLRTTGEDRWLVADYVPASETQQLNIIRDITERKQMEEALRRRVRELDALQQTVLDVTARRELSGLLHDIVERAARLLEAQSGGMYLCDPEREEVRCVVSYNTPNDYTGTVLKYGEGAAGIVAQTKSPLIINDYRTWEGRATVFEEEQPFTAVLTVPMIWQDDVIGTIDVLDAGKDRWFTVADLELLTLFASHATIAVENARLYEQAHQNAEDRAILLREVNHRVKNNLTAIVGLIRAARRRMDGMGPEALSTLQELINQVESWVAVHQLLSASEWSPVLLSDLAVRVIRSSLQAFAREWSISLDVDASDVRVTPDQAHNLALVINELATNTVKYAGEELSRIVITIRVQLEADWIRFEFRDDGPGYPEDVLQMERHNVGLDLVRGIVRRNLQGELALSNEGGAVTVVRFKREANGEGGGHGEVDL